MFNLDDQMLMWKLEIEKIENLTNDDVEELESHILDKIDDLQSRGYTLEESFDIAINKIGTNDLLSEEYKKVNTKLSVFQKITYGIIGFICVDFVFQIINIITMMIGSHFANKLLTSEVINIPIVSKFIVLLAGESYNNNLSVFSLLLAIILNIGAIYIILANKKNVIIYFIKIMEKVKVKKYYFILSVIIPISMFLIPLIITGIIGANEDIIYLSNILIMIDLVNRSSLIVLMISLTKEISKSIRNRYKLTILSGYIGGSLIFNSLPHIVTIVLISLGITSITVLLLVYLLMASTIIYFVVMKKSKRTSNRNKILNVGICILGIVILNPILLLPILTVKISPTMYGEISYSIEIIEMISIITLPCISYIYILFENTKNINKKQKVKS